MDILKTDTGATFVITSMNDGTLVVVGQNTWTRYVSSATTLKITGRNRKHGTFGGYFSHPIGYGRRAILSLDNGEGIVKIPGVILTPNLRP